ncbi:anti-sigma factor [Emticicia aquatilis]|uniref:Anti-sigma factor n=1 Tax=Emticicia aquatilis TaxID=1537369 RepID=A0A916YTT4_9BACT|nr:FecR family protein [Emticicia aquatilis]GGD60018.1 anti-sigma factor [Emticicia aquatilis]
MILNKEIIERFLNNKSTQQERELIEAWYYSFEKNLDGISQLTDEEQLHLENELYLKIKEKISPVEKTPARQINWVWYLSGAAAMLLLAFGLWTYNKSTKNIQTISGVPFSGWAKYENVSAKELKVTLPDGSLVVLQPKTQLSYNQSDTKFREVNLTGEAFFDVMHDATRPFLIYTGKMTTKVLGTSFSIKAFPSMKKSEVSVVSGKVTVYEKDAESKHSNGVILTPNLKVTFFDEEEHFVTGLVEKPEVLPSIKKENISFNFKDAPLNEVLTTLEKAYGIEMVLENESLGNCTLNGDLSEMPLFTKLDIITRSLNATYQVKGTSILVSGAGCE